MTRRDNILLNIDWFTVFLWVALVVFGWMNIYSANIMKGDGTVMDFSQRYGKQFIWLLVSIILILIIFLLDAKFFPFFAYLLYGITIVTLLAVLVFGKEINGAKSWFVIGGFQFQPSEFAKLFTALALARLLSSYGFVLKNFKSLVLAGSIILAPALLIMVQPDLGSMMVYFAFIFVLYREGFPQNLMVLGSILIILFVITLLVEKIYILPVIWIIALIVIKLFKVPLKSVLYIFAAGILPAGILVFFMQSGQQVMGYESVILISIAASLLFALIIAIRLRNNNLYKIIAGMVISILFVISVDYAINNTLKEHQKQRIYVTLGIEDDPQGVGYNVNQSKIAIGSGGFSGKGFLNGTQTKLQFVPEQSTDFIFCTVGEEWGFIGASAVVILFVLMIVRLVILSERQRSDFSRIYGYGFISVLIVHFTVNVGMTIGLFPVIGIPLPFFSYGGSSLLAFTLFLFIFLKLDSNRKELLR
ncbi:MAG: rod shape-determining protein RodA [Bacteroidales bacterium]|nr:rod shape-determining protein RodA [Bacteroidales bacterium]